jgi:hypothetical protein
LGFGVPEVEDEGVAAWWGAGEENLDLALVEGVPEGAEV